MKRSRYELDPDGDVDFVLKRPNKQQLVWPGNKPPPGSDAARTRDENQETFPSPGKPQSRKPSDASASAAAAAAAAIENADGAGDEEGQQQPPPSSSAEGEEEAGVEEKRFRVSSRHLSLASPVFKQILEGALRKSSTTAAADGQQQQQQRREVTVEAREWDAEAALILLNIVHGRTEEVPPTLHIEMLAKFAALVDHYKCHEAVKVFTSMWVKALEDDPELGKLPAEYGKESMTWLFVSWVFNLPENFTSMVYLATSQAKAPIETMFFPLPGPLIFYMDNARHKAIEDFFDHMIKLRDDLASHMVACPHGGGLECSSMLLGQLVMFMKSLGVEGQQYQHEQHQHHKQQPPRPFYGISLVSLMELVKNLPKLSWHNPRCSLRSKLDAALDLIEKQIPDVKITSFPASESSSLEADAEAKIKAKAKAKVKRR